MIHSNMKPVLTAADRNPIFITYHPGCCGAGRETAERRFLQFPILLPETKFV